MNVRHIKRNIKKAHPMRFPLAMYNTLPGSIILSAYILSEDKPSVEYITNRWNELVEKNEPFGYEENEDPIEKTLNLFNLKRPEYFPVAFIQSDLNALVVPYIDGELLPIREDLMLTNTYLHGKIYPISYGDEND